jgi:hypothetical protein
MFTEANLELLYTTYALKTNKSTTPLMLSGHRFASELFDGFFGPVVD